LLQAHFSRIPLAAAVAGDVEQILPDACRLLQAMVDVISSNGWLAPALACMELSQMVTQALWNSDSILLQVPHFTKELAKRCEAQKILSVSDLLEMEDQQRLQLLNLEPTKLHSIVEFCNGYPDVDVKFDVLDKDKIVAQQKMVMQVTLTRDPDDEEEEELKGVPIVVAPRYPQPKAEGWWLVVGNQVSNELIAIKRVAFKRRVMQERLEFVAPAQGQHKLMLYFMSDSYLGVDQELAFDLKVAAAPTKADDDDDDEGQGQGQDKKEKVQEKEKDKDKDKKHVHKTKQ